MGQTITSPPFMGGKVYLIIERINQMNKTVDIIYGDDLIELEKVDGEWVTKSDHWLNHTCKVEHNYKREELVKYLEENFDQWSNQEDWWGGTDKWDVNVFTDDFFTDNDYGQVFQISVYGLQLMQGYLQVDTSTELDEFWLHL